MQSFSGPVAASAAFDTEQEIDVRHGPVNTISAHKNFYLINKNCGNCSPGDRVMNGKDAELFEFPWIVLLGVKVLLTSETAHICGGSLISERFVLTGLVLSFRDDF